MGSSGLERELVPESGLKLLAYADVAAGPIAGVSPGRKLISMLKFTVGIVQSMNLMRRYHPQVLLLTGGWSGLPVALAARLWRVPTLIFLPDIEPGSTIRLLQRFAQRVALTLPESAEYFPPGKTVVTGYPLRGEVENATREAAIEHFGLQPDKQTLLVFGGSRGARSINRALLSIVPDLLQDGLQIIHVTGTLDWPEIEAGRDQLADKDHYHIYPYLHHDMGLALVAAELVVSRSGASTLAEFPRFGLPAILVPYPYAWRYQKVNADYLVNRGAAQMLADEQMPQELLPGIRALMGNAARLSQMRDSAAALAQPQGAERIVAQLVQLAGDSA